MPFYGSTGSLHLNAPIVGMASTPDGGGYWLVASDGGIFSFGDAHFYGSTGSLHLNAPIVGMASTPDGRGYWLVASDGGIFSFGDAFFYGSTGSLRLNQPVVGMSATQSGHGYWLVAADGGVFAFGNAGFFGSVPGILQPGQSLDKPVVSIITASNGAGYFMVAADGGTFSFGSAPFYGSLGGLPLRNPIVAAASNYVGNGYWFTDDTGLVSNFGYAEYDGSAPSPLNRPIVGMAEGPGNGTFEGDPYPPGAYGYDVSVYQCGNLPTGDHQIAIVQVDGASAAATNPCLGQEAAWAGGGLNLYTFLTYGTSATPEPGCNGDQACNEGYAAGIHAFDDARAAGVDTSVSWWLDVEADGHWSGNPGENVALIKGALTALHETEGGGERRHLRQPRRLEQHRRRLPARHPLLDGRLPRPAERTGLVRRLRALVRAGAAAVRAARGRAVRQCAVRRGLLLLSEARPTRAHRDRLEAYGVAWTAATLRLVELTWFTFVSTIVGAMTLPPIDPTPASPSLFSPHTHRCLFVSSMYVVPPPLL